MPVVILLDESLLHLVEKEVGDKYPLEIHRGDFQTTKQTLSNMDKNTLYILLNCTLKPHRYEIYCLAKKQEVSYVVVSPEKLSTAKHDTPCLPNPQNLLEHLRTLKCSTAHKKKMVTSTYLSRVKEGINQINSLYPPSSLVILRDCETRLMKMISLNPVPLEEVKECYRQMIEESSSGL